MKKVLIVLALVAFMLPTVATTVFAFSNDVTISVVDDKDKDKDKKAAKKSSCCDSKTKANCSETKKADCGDSKTAKKADDSKEKKSDTAAAAPKGGCN